LGTDPRNTSFDLVLDGQVIASDLRDKTNFTDPQGNSQSIYQVVVKVGGVETERTEAVTPWSDVYQVLQLDRPADGIDDLTGAPYSYTPNDCAVGDVDGDGFDEIIFGGAAIDHDGWLLYSTGLGHGDALHVADIMPDRPGYEVMRCCEAGNFGLEMHDAATGEPLFRQYAGKDTGRCLAADVMPGYRGLEFWGAQGSMPRETASGTFETVSSVMPSVNFRIYWDGDLQDELFDGALDSKTGIAHPVIQKWNGTKLVSINMEAYNHSQTCNWTKATLCLQADLFGDWREELVMWNYDDPSQLNIFTTRIPSEYRVPTPMHDHNYRLAVAFQNVGYNQPPHLSYYLPDADFSYPEEPVIDQTASYQVMEMAGGRVVRTTEGSGDRNVEVSVPYRRYNVVDGKLYVRMPSGGPKGLEYNHYFMLTVDGQQEVLEYDETGVTSVVYLSEGEDIEGMTPCESANALVRSSNSQAAYAADGPVAFTTLPAGLYQLTAFIHDASSKTVSSDRTFMAGDREIAKFHCDVINIQEFTSDEFAIYEETPLYIPQSNNKRSGIDLIYIVKTGDALTGIENITPAQQAAEVYSLDGRRLMGKPTAKGIYVINGEKIVVK